MDDRARELANQLVRNWLLDEGVALTGSHGEPTATSVRLMRESLEIRVAAAIDEREREALEQSAKEAENHHESHPEAICGITIATIIRSLIKESK